MSAAEEFIDLPSEEAIEAAVDKGIAAARERVAELVGTDPSEGGEFWADGTERDNLVRIAKLSILGHSGSAGPKEPPSEPFPTDVLVNGSHAAGRYVATVSMELGINYRDMNGRHNGLGPVLCRYAAHEMARLEYGAGAPRP